MKLNFQVRMKNKQWLLTFMTVVLAFIYQLLGLFEVVPKVSQDQVVNLVSVVINILAITGVVIDPTTAGLRDSDRAMTYSAPQGRDLNGKRGEK